MKALIISLGLCLSVASASSQTLTPTAVEELAGNLKTNPKPILVKLYTDWCTYCRLQDKQLKDSKPVADYIEKNFNYLNINAESRKEIKFNNTIYRFKPHGLNSGINELALYLTGGNKELSYPCWIILDEQYKVIASYQGYLKSKDLMLLLRGAAENRNVNE